MKPVELFWFQLGFPRDLSPDAVLAALTSLSGAPHSARIVFDLEATNEGITHRLAITKGHEEILMAALRAAIPSLRVDSTAAPSDASSARLLWQLSPARATLRADDVAASAAGLLSGLFPLARSEVVRLSWTMRPHPQPPHPATARTPKDSQQALTAKSKLPIVKAVGELRVQAEPSRVRQLIQRVSAPLWSLRTPHGRLVADPPLWGQAGFRLGKRGRHFNVAELWPSLDGRWTDRTCPAWSLAQPSESFLVQRSRPKAESSVPATSPALGKASPSAHPLRPVDCGAWALPAPGRPRCSRT